MNLAGVSVGRVEKDQGSDVVSSRLEVWKRSVAGMVASARTCWPRTRHLEMLVAGALADAALQLIPRATEALMYALSTRNSSPPPCTCVVAHGPRTSQRRRKRAMTGRWLQAFAQDVKK